MILVLAMVVAFPLALLASYLHSRRLGWDPNVDDQEADRG